jgi:hypothetical protein
MSATGSRTKGIAPAAPQRWPAIAARVFTVSLGLAAVGWGIFAAPVAWRQAAMAPVATKIIAGERFGPGVLEQYLTDAHSVVGDRFCEPVTLRALAITRLRLAEEAISASDSAVIGQTEVAGEAALRRALSCTPTDPFLWFALFWMQNSTRGLQKDNFKMLRLSYQTGPNEGWLSIRRNRLAIAIYPSLPSDLKEAAADEFVQLVKSDLITDAADILAGPGRPVRGMLLHRLEGMDETKLRFLSILLAGKGIDDAFPGLDPSSRFQRH